MTWIADAVALAFLVALAWGAGLFDERDDWWW